MRISDWSSDVCSSDLQVGEDHGSATRFAGATYRHRRAVADLHLAGDDDRVTRAQSLDDLHLAGAPLAERDRGPHRLAVAQPEDEIGQASCRERVCQYGSISVVAVSLKQKKTRN